MPNEVKDVDKITDTFATYFANLYWNHLYKEANNAVGARYDSINEAYRDILDIFSVSMCKKDSTRDKDNKNYRTIIGNVREYYGTYHEKYVTYTDFVLFIIRTFYPDDYRNLNNARCDSAFRGLIGNTITKFTSFIINDQKQIDNIVSDTGRKSPNIYQVPLYHKFSELLSAERNALASLMMASKNGVNVAKVAENLGSNTVISETARQLINKYTHKFEVLLQEKAAITRKHNMLLDACKKCNDLIKDKDQIITEKTAIIATLEEQIRRYRAIDSTILKSGPVMSRPVVAAKQVEKTPEPAIVSVDQSDSSDEDDDDSDVEVEPTDFDIQEEAQSLLDN